MRASAPLTFTLVVAWCAPAASACTGVKPSTSVRTARFSSQHEAVTVNEARRAPEVGDEAERMPRLQRLIQAMMLARPGERVWVERVHGLARPSELAERLDAVLAPERGVRGAPGPVVGDDETGVVVIAADETTYLRIRELLRRPVERHALGEVQVLPLRHADAQEVARRLRPVVERLQRSRAPRATGTQATADGARSDPQAFADVTTNSIVILSSVPAASKALHDAISSLDVESGKPPRRGR